tara:strand:+ start:75 stop:464 length:390 start_codon:yes stop_codon:yes gene_type:complete
MAMTIKKEKKQSKGVAGSGLTQKELKDLKQIKQRTNKPSKTYKARGMEMPPDRRTDEQKKQDAIDSLLGAGDTVSDLKLTSEMLKQIREKGVQPMKKGGEVKGYMGGGSVHKKKNKMATTKGWGASRKT